MHLFLLILEYLLPLEIAFILLYYMPTILPGAFSPRYFRKFSELLLYTYTKSPFRSYICIHIIHLWNLQNFALADNFKAIHIWAKHGRYDNRPIFLLIIFHDSSYRSSNSKPRPVQCMNKFRLIPLMPAEADICPACLKIKTVGARGNFSILLLPWHPHFDIISFC